MLNNKIVVFDLDDTLFKEADFVKSGYKAILEWIELHYTNTKSVSVDNLWQIYKAGGNVFETINKELNIGISIAQYRFIYHNHIPNIKLDGNTIRLLDTLMNKGCVIGLITDGYKDTQLNKIQALNLMRYIKRDNIIISEEFGSEKPNPSNYIYFMNKYPDQEYIYVGDNIQKDFLAANELQWTTICLLDDGQNIHKQEFDKFNNQFQPQIKIENILQVLNYI